MKNILLVQASFVWIINKKAMYLPYAIGCLWANCQNSDLIKQNYHLLDLQVERFNIDEVVNSYEDIDVAGFSCYCWNYNYTCKLAEKIKERFPNCLIVFGGPEVEHSDPKIFQNKPYIDVAVKQEGDVVLKDILEARISNTDLSVISGLIINDNGNAIDTGPTVRINNLEHLPSPYTTGVFDFLFEKYPDVQWDGMIDTNRGCPYQCTYCDWGSLTYSKIRVRHLDTVKKELEWFSKNKIEVLYINDANFGILYERDMEIAKYLSELRIATGYPKYIVPNWPKNSREQIINIAKELSRPNKGDAIRSGITISVQTFTPETLKEIKRDQFDINEVKDFVKECTAAGLSNDVDMILGLPMETLESWKDGFYYLFESGMHHNFKVQPTALLENTELNKLQRKLNGIKTIPSRITANQNYDYSPEIKETLAIVVETNTLPFNDHIKAIMFTNIITTVHGSGLITEFARFTCKHLSLSFKEFYEKVIDLLLIDPMLQAAYNECEQEIVKVYTGLPGNFKYGLTQHAEFQYFNTLCVVGQLQTNIKQIVYDYYEPQLDADLFAELCEYNDFCYFDYEKKHLVSETKSFTHNLHEFINNDVELLRNQVTYTFTNATPHEENLSLVEFATRIFQRQRNMPNKAHVEIAGTVSTLAKVFAQND
jgi:tRNA A37 methylthiotransferase MiaB